MLKKIGKVIMNNFGLKVLAVIFAIVLWLAIVNTADPEKAATFTVPIEVINADYLTDEGKTFEVLGNTDSISFTVTGKRSIVEKLTADDFRAIANMEDIDDSMTMVPIVLTATSYSTQVDITKRASYLMVEVEDLITKEFEIRVVAGGTPQNDYFVAGTEASPDYVNVTGPQSVVDQIAYAEAVINVNGAEETLSSVADILLRNENGGQVDAENLTMDAVSTDVTARILERKTVPISFEVTGVPEEGFWYSGLECDVDSLTIEGDPDVLDEIDEIVLSSPRLSVRRAQGDVELTLWLDTQLPAGVSLAEDEPESLEVTLIVEPSITVEAELSARNFTVVGLGDGYELEFLTDPITAMLTGPEEAIDSINTNRLSLELDVTGLKPGEHAISVVQDTDNYRLDATVTFSITEEDTSGILGLDFL